MHTTKCMAQRLAQRAGMHACRHRPHRAKSQARARGGGLPRAHLQGDLLVVAVYGVVLVDVEGAAPLAVRALLRLDLEGGLAGLHQRPELVAAGAAEVVEDGHLGVHARAARHDARHLDERVEVRVPACPPTFGSYVVPVLAARQLTHGGSHRAGRCPAHQQRGCGTAVAPGHGAEMCREARQLGCMRSPRHMYAKLNGLGCDHHDSRPSLRSPVPPHGSRERCEVANASSLGQHIFRSYGLIHILP